MSLAVWVVNSRSARRIDPEVIRPAAGSSRMIDMPVMVFPQPDSPTRPTVSPGATSKEIPSTAVTRSRPRRICVRRSRTSRRVTSTQLLAGGVGRSVLQPGTPDACRATWVEDRTHVVAEVVAQQDGRGDGEAGERRHPPGGAQV